MTGSTDEFVFPTRNNYIDMELIKSQDPETLARVCKENFTISEIIFNMIHSDTFRVKLENLEIRIISDNSLLFRNDTYTPYDILNFYGSMYENFEKLLSECWITIKHIRINGDSNFSFLFDYCLKNIQCDNLETRNTDKINEFEFDSDLAKPSEIKKFLKKVNKSSRINIRMMTFSDAQSSTNHMLNYFDEFKVFFTKFNGFNFEIKWAFTIMTDNDNDVAKLKSQYDALMRYKDKNPSISFDDFEIMLNIQIGCRFPCRLDYQIDRLCSLLDIKLITHVILASMAFVFDIDYSCLKKFKYLEIFVLGAPLELNYRTLGDWRNMKYLKSLNFLSPGVDYKWLSDYIPSTVEIINITQHDESTSNNNSKFIIPPNLKLMKLEVQDKTIFDFSRFKFENARDLTNIFLYVESEFGLGGNQIGKINSIKIQGVRKFPDCVKILTVEDGTGLNLMKPQKGLEVSGVDLSGIYTNFGKTNKYLHAVEN